MTTTTSKQLPGDLPRNVLAVIGIGLLIAGTLRVLEPFVGALLWATMIAVSTWPVMLRLQGWCGGRRGAAVAVMTVVLLLLLFVPLGLAIATILEHSDQALELLKSLPAFRMPPPPDWLVALPLVGPRAAARWQALAALPPEELASTLAPYFKTALAWFAAKAGSLGGLVLHFILTVILTAVLYVRGEGATEHVRRFFRRLAGDRGDVIVTLSGQAIRAVALGIVVTAAIQTVLSAAGLYVGRVPAAGFLAAVVFVLCIVQLGPLLVLGPAVIWLYASGAAVRGTVLLVFLLLAQTLDNVIRPLLIKRGADISLLVIFPGVIGGLLWLGVIGLFVGPVVLAVTVTLVEDWIATGLGERAPAGAPAAEGAGPAQAPGAGAGAV
jgi:predicted PurR-regulated permease PerM